MGGAGVVRSPLFALLGGGGAVETSVLAYSGGLDTSVAIPWLTEHRPGARVVAMCCDLGQGDDMDAVRCKASMSGADAVHIIDAREGFLRDDVLPTLGAGAVYEGRYLLGTS